MLHAGSIYLAQKEWFQWARYSWMLNFRSPILNNTETSLFVYLSTYLSIMTYSTFWWFIRNALLPLVGLAHFCLPLNFQESLVFLEPTDSAKYFTLCVSSILGIRLSWCLSYCRNSSCLWLVSPIRLHSVENKATCHLISMC